MNLSALPEFLFLEELEMEEEVRICDCCERCFDEFEDEIEEYGYKPTPILLRKRETILRRRTGSGWRRQGQRQRRQPQKHRQCAWGKHLHQVGRQLGRWFWDRFPPHDLRVSHRGNELEGSPSGSSFHGLPFPPCGLHVHVNRNAFGDNQAEQQDVISRILFFVEKHWNELFTFSRRSSYNMSRWSARFGFEKTGKQILEKAKSGCNGRYVAVNLNNYHTIFISFIFWYSFFLFYSFEVKMSSFIILHQILLSDIALQNLSHFH